MISESNLEAKVSGYLYSIDNKAQSLVETKTSNKHCPAGILQPFNFDAFNQFFAIKFI